MAIRNLRNLCLTMLCLGALAAASGIPVTIVSPPAMGGPTQGVYYYPYTLQVGGPNGADVTVACDDYFDDVSIGESWTATANTFADLSGTLFYDGGKGVNDYKQAAWLYEQLQPYNANAPSNSVNAAINWAIWDTFNNVYQDVPGNSAKSPAPGLNTGNPTSNTSSTYWLNLAGIAAANNYYGDSFSSFVIYTPTSWANNNALSDRPQEYIATPEPTTAVLWLGGLLALGLFAWRRREVQA